ncbi:arsenic metallochaperone ArsD family protein [uncultured Methanocorpusculum sp.]|nr:arsenic metallochaperone ArsD family protein [uncultured Methanocorpusculum sp.]
MSSMCLYEAKDPDTTHPEYIRITELIEKLKPKGILIERARYDTNPNVARLISLNGEKILPAVVVNNFVMITGRYPSNEEVRQILHVSDSLIERKTHCGCCCIPGFECDE